MTRRLDYLVFDADNHMYEATDAFTKYLPAGYEGVIKYVEVNGRTKIAIKNKISDYIPNPTFNKVAPPGAQELEFKLKNPDSMTAADKELQLAPPPKYIEAPVELLQRHHRHTHVRHAAVDRGRSQPQLPGAPATTRRERRGEAHLGHAEDRGDLGRIARERVDGEAVDVPHRESGVLECREDRGAHHRGLRLRVGPSTLVVGRRADADDCGLVLDAHQSENRVLTIARSNPRVG